jgi:hypothetical protein
MDYLSTAATLAQYGHNPGQILTHRLDLPGLQAHPDLHAQGPDRIPSRIALAQLIARAGPAKAAKKPSPMVATSRPPKRSGSTRRIT